MASSEVTRYCVYPDGWHDSPLDSKRWFVLYVERRGPGEDSWVVTDGFEELSSAGNFNAPDKRTRRFHRFGLAEALRRAEEAVESRVIGSGTFAQLDAEARRRRAAQP